MFTFEWMVSCVEPKTIGFYYERQLQKLIWKKPYFHMHHTLAEATTWPLFSCFIFDKIAGFSTTTAGNRQHMIPFRILTQRMWVVSVWGLIYHWEKSILGCHEIYWYNQTSGSVIERFRIHRDQVRKTITRNPLILFVNTDRNLKPKIEFMKSLGLTVQDFRNAISTGFRLLTSSLVKTLCPNIQYLQNLFG